MGPRLFADGESRAGRPPLVLVDVCLRHPGAGGGRFAIVLLFPLSSLAAAWGGGWKVRKVYCAIVDCR